MPEKLSNMPPIETFEQHGESHADSSRKLNAEEYVAYHKSNDPNFSEQEFNIHQERYEKASKGLWRKIRYPNSSSAVDIAHEEAIIANNDWNKKFKLVTRIDEATGKDISEKELKGEYKEWIRMMLPIIANMKLKRDNPDSPEAKSKNIMMIDMGGGIAGANGGGQSLAMIDMGFFPQVKNENGEPETVEEKEKRKIINTLVGISVGAAIGGFTLAGREQAKAGASLFYRDCMLKEFINFLRVHQIMNVGFIVDRMRRGKKRMDVETIGDSPTDFYVQVADPDTGEPTLVNAKTAKEGILEAIHGSMALPWLYGKKVKVNDKEVIDGGIRPLPIQKIISEIKPTPTDIIILPNIPFEESGAFELDIKEQLLVALTKIFPKAGSSVLFQKVLIQRMELRKVFEFIKSQTGISISILWPPNTGLSTATNDPDKVIGGMLESYRQTFEIFGEQEKAKGIELLDY